ncbi:hypothetical protein DB345_06260 [Spartobacteria bacterium LR76]|nr:hypothetical protein DB345_06260 [Spartobacteria bacterium LR76]
MFTICNVGCGRHARGYHGPSQRKYQQSHPGTVLAACCDSDEERARAYRDEFGFARSYKRIEEMLEQENPDAVCMVLPPGNIVAAAPEVMRRNIPVLVEKPPALTEHELEQLLACQACHGAGVQVAFNRRYAPLMAEARRILEEQLRPEDALQINYEMIRNNRLDPDFSTTAIHAIDGALFLARSPYRRAEFHYHELASLGQGVAGLSLTGEFCCGTRFRCNFQPTAGATFERVVVHGMDFTLSVHLPMWGGFDSPGCLQYWQDDKLIREISGAELCPSGADFEQAGFYAETEAFLDNVRAGQPLEPSLYECRQPVILMEAFRNREKYWSSRQESVRAETLPTT